MQLVFCHVWPYCQYESSVAGLLSSKDVCGEKLLTWSATENLSALARRQQFCCFLELGVHKRMVVLTLLCRPGLMLKPARPGHHSPSTGSNEGDLPAPTHPKTYIQDSPVKCWSLCKSHSCLSVRFLEVLSLELPLNQAGAVGWKSSYCIEQFSGLLRDRCAPHLGSLSSWDENWVEFPENNFSYFNMKW